MSLTTRIFLACFLLVGIGLVLLLQSTLEQIRPALRQASEETLVDTANLLAELAARDFQDGLTANSSFHQAVLRYRQRQPDADIWSQPKMKTSFIVYVTDHNGRVLFHTQESEIGRDYSRWIDVSRTLRGEYGARTTPSDPSMVAESIMYVAAPVLSEGDLLGVLSVGQPINRTQPFLDIGRAQIWQRGAIILILALGLAAVFSYWLTRSIRQLVRYVEQVRDGRKSQPPRLRERELARLAEATESMRQEIEGKRYVEHYIHTLTHEMKSPLSAIRGASELLLEPGLPEVERQRFIHNIDIESTRMQRLTERLLSLAAIEARDTLQDVERIDFGQLVDEELQRKQLAMEQRPVMTDYNQPNEPVMITGERFLLEQAVSNLLDNAIEFAEAGSRIEIILECHDRQAILGIINKGPCIPDYARHRLFERFYSLARPHTGKKGSGLGLTFVREVAELHHGEICLDNQPDNAVKATLRLPR